MPLVAITIGAPRKAPAYVDALNNAGLDAEVLTVDNAPADLTRYDALLLAGGSDVDPSLYGEPLTQARDIDAARDAMELRLLQDALDRDLPVLAICRGLQLMNVHYGGTLHQHIDNHTKPKSEPWLRHNVALRTGSTLHRAVASTYYEIVSRHHQAVKHASPRLLITARAEDGTVEALEDTSKHFVVAVQWHPEDNPDSAEDRALFAAFARAVAERDV